jgi:hypothetical protein
VARNAGYNGHILQTLSPCSRQFAKLVVALVVFIDQFSRSSLHLSLPTAAEMTVQTYSR